VLIVYDKHMTVQPVLQLGDPLLRSPCREVSDTGDPAIDPLAADLADTLADWVQRTSYGRGIAAPQIGVPVRVVYLNFDGPKLLINPVIIARSAKTWEPWDACLSFSVEIFCRVRRATWVDVSYQPAGGGCSTIRAEGELGELLQHEIDHLDGVLAVDRMTSVSTLCMRSEFERRYRDSSPYRR
jgi:peptide deformylase